MLEFSQLVLNESVLKDILLIGHFLIVVKGIVIIEKNDGVLIDVLIWACK